MTLFERLSLKQFFITINYGRCILFSRDMSPGPMEVFAGLLRSCISDTGESKRTREALEGAGVLLLGLACSLATSYLMAVLGVAV